MKRVYTDRELIELANNCSSLKEFREKYKNEYQYAWKRNLLQYITLKRAKKENNPIKIGEHFGNLIVISKDDTNGNTGYRYKCFCVCGKEKIITGKNLRQGTAKSCGCSRIGKLLKSPGVISWNSLYAVSRYHSKKRGYEFSITIEEFKNISSKNCFYCDIEPRKYNKYVKNDGITLRSNQNVTSNSIDNGWIICNGIDRVDNRKGYTLENSVACCDKCNTMKLDHSLPDWVKHMEKILSNLQKK